ncbi:MAG: ABC-F family ATP-binding cassette domain-containing protein [Pseudomonadales bacterium]
MSVLLQCHRLNHAMGTKPLFKDLDLSINSGDRIGLVGHNGCGKSTLFSIISNQISPDEGDISRTNNLLLETVEQFIDPALNEFTLLEALCEKLSPEERDFSRYKAVMLLQKLGFNDAELHYQVEHISGGQQNRLMFARAVINDPTLILFDEPTNHLDLKTLLFFEEFLSSLDAAYLLISHDRQFLDAVTDRTLFLRDNRIISFNLSYTEARIRLEEQDVAAESTRKVEEKKIRELKASAKRLALWGKVYDNEKLARKAKSMEKRVEKMEENKTFVTRGSGLKLSLDVKHSHANRMIQIEDQQIMSPGENPSALFHIEDFLIRPGDRVALLGHNGTGKTTLIKQILNHYHGNKGGQIVKFNPQCDIGYYDQELEMLNPERSMVQSLTDNCPGSENDNKTALIKAGFPYLDLDKKVGVLSGGEKARLMFLIIKLNKPNFLILDEPTNHIDIQGKEELETQILDANATVLITSHDRRFVDIIADRYVLIDKGKLVEIHDPQVFYDIERPAPVKAGNNPASRTIALDNEDSILQRMVELEMLLAEDKARKQKFQKPRMQDDWLQEIGKLNTMLE